MPSVLARAAEALGAGCVNLPGVGHSPNDEAPEALVPHLLRLVRGD